MTRFVVPHPAASTGPDLTPDKGELPPVDGGAGDAATPLKMRSIKDIIARTERELGPGSLALPHELQQLATRTQAYAAASQAKNTRRAYERQWRAFQSWCAKRGLPSLPAAPAVLAAYLASLADSGTAVASMAQALSAISDAHRHARELPPNRDPDVERLWSGIKRERGRPPRQARPLSPKELRAMIRALHPGLKAVRDRCLMLVGFAGALRREEVVGIWVEHIARLQDGRARLFIPRSKGDQEAQGQHVILPRGSDRATCPVSALDDWLSVSGITAGPIFLGIQRGKLTAKTLWPGDVAKILKAAAKRAGIPVKLTSGHSLRRGLATTARREGRSLDAIQRQARHANINTTLRYVDVDDLERLECAAEGIGL